MRSRTLLTLVLFSTALLLAACPKEVTIQQINEDPGRYAGKDVAVRGTVTNSFGALGTGAYELDDGTGKIWIISEKSGVPSKGAKVRAAGKVNVGVTYAGRSFGNVIRESGHRVDSSR